LGTACGVNGRSKMTANSQFISGKGIWAFFKRSLELLKLRVRRWSLTVVRTDGKLVKRIFDILFSLFVLIFFSPVYLGLTLLIFLSSPGPIFYVQERVGKNFNTFDCIKFRTMVSDADAVLGEILATSPQIRAEFEDNFKLKQDPRITGIGHFLRITSLDEFPQFWNVLKGDMSVVGPRPLVDEELHKYGRSIDKVLTIKPGITGLWQVSGRNDIPYPQRVKIDVYYVNSRDLWMDFWIIIKTIGVVLFPKNNGAY
jgi:Undecaprenyl-phosphate galactose phosphotransferase WbaP